MKKRTQFIHRSKQTYIIIYHVHGVFFIYAWIWTDLKASLFPPPSTSVFFFSLANTVLKQKGSDGFLPSFLKKREQHLSDNPVEKKDISQLAKLQ